jgi:hypothetical protein
MADDAALAQQLGDLVQPGAARDDDVDRLAKRPRRLVLMPDEPDQRRSKKDDAERREGDEAKRAFQ